MSRFSTSLGFITGLSIATMLSTVPTKLYAETDAHHRLNLQSQTPATVVTPVKSVPAQTIIRDPQSPIQQQPDLRPLPSTETSKSGTGASKEPTTTPAKPVAATTQPPVENVINLVLKLKEKRVYVYKGDKLLKRYPVAIGKKGWETPTGEWQVMEKIKNPAWTSFKTGEVFPAGAENPLGSRWIGFWTDGQDVIGFHGTPNVKSIGTAASHGCVRMLNRDVKALFPLVKVGTTVKVVNE
jgi:lipoprotein-anchoring transpeptidase ErfK/SrfK